MASMLLGPIPYPIIGESGDLANGYLLEVANYCSQKCQDRVCSNYQPSGPGEAAACFTCPNGFSVIVARVHGTVLRIPGVLETGSSTATPSFKREHKHRKIRLSDVAAWLTSLRSYLPSVQGAVRDEANSTISALHDIKSLIGTILQTAETSISSQSGASFDEKVDAAPESLRTIYHACRVLESLLQFTDVVANPDSAYFGKPIRRRLHAMLKMLLRVFEAKAADRDITLSLRGSSYNQPMVLSSFIIIPVVLIDNAIKHSDSGTEVVVNIRDSPDGGVRIEFCSNGTLVPERDRGRIFERGFRGENAVSAGSGLGLQVAQHVATANAANLHYEARPRFGSSVQGSNVFILSVTGTADNSYGE